jgi:hypothetical protein
MQKKSVDYVSRQLPLQGLDWDSEYHSQESTQSEQLGQKPINPLSKVGRTNQTIGLAGEDLVRYLLHRWEYDIFEPCNPSSSCDFVIHHDNKWIPIQVKATEKKDSIYLKRRRHNSKGINSNRERFSYGENDFEFLFIVKFLKIYIIPYSAIKYSKTVIIKDYENYSYDLTDPETFNNPPQL